METSFRNIVVSPVKVSVSWNGDIGDYLVQGNAKIKCMSPAQIKEFLISEKAAGYFRDIGTYDSYSRDAQGTVRTSYAAGWGIFKTKVHLEMREGPRESVEFKSHQDDVLRVAGKWEMVHIGQSNDSAVLLTQTIRPNRLPAWIPLRKLIRSRITRALRDLQLILLK